MDDRRSGDERRETERGGRREADDVFRRLVKFRVMNAIAAHGLSVFQAADRCGLSYSTLYGILRCRDVKVSTIRAVSKGLQIPIADLLKDAA